MPSDLPPDFEIRPLRSPGEYRACVELQDITWGAGFGESVPPTILRLTQELGGIASGAFDPAGRLLGFVFGITGWVEGRPVHWSDMLAVHPHLRGRGIGEALKRHQRLRLLDLGVTLARWTYDPLEARNARLNLSRLGGTASTYLRDYYGDGVSALHQGIGTDRLIVDWYLDSRRVDQRLRGLLPPPDLDELHDMPVLNPPHVQSGIPDCADPHLDVDETRLLVAVPADIQAVKRAYPEAARRWRAVTRQCFETCLSRSYRVTEFVRETAFGYYLLER